MKKFFVLLLMFAGLVLTGCAKTVTTYIQPQEYEIKNTRVYNKGYDEVWKATVDSIATNFWSIDNVQKDSGIITISFATDEASRWVDCGMMHHVVTQGVQDITYSMTDPNVALKQAVGGGNVWDVVRTVRLIAKSNIIVKKEGSSKTRVTINTNYNLVCKYGAPLITPLVGAPFYFGQPTTSSQNFTTIKEGRDNEQICRSKNTLEENILDAIQLLL